MTGARTELTIARAIRCAARRPDRVAVMQGETSFTYGELARRLNRAAHLASGGLGLRPGDRALLVAPNCLPYVEIVAGLADAGVIVATLSPALSPAELDGIVEDCEPRLAILDRGVEWRPPSGVPVLRLGSDYETQLARASDGAFPSAAKEEDAFGLAYTSGTTGQPKGVLLSHRSRTLTFLGMAAEYGCFGPDDRFLAIAPMCHGAGFAFAVAPLAIGGTLTLFDGGDAERLASRLGEGDVTGVFVVPTHVARLAALSPGLLARRREHGLKAIISNAAALPQAAKEFVIDQFGDGLLHESYGSTEAGIVTNIRPTDLRRRPGSVGLPFANMEVELRRQDGSIAGVDEAGELFARGATGFSGYWRRPTDTDAAIRDGWITVGDLARRDADGFITILDRKKDMIISGGLNIYPCEIELAIAELAGVREVAVVGRPDPEWGERPHAFVVGTGVSEPMVLDQCRRILAGYKQPLGVTIVDALPRNPSGKLLKRELRVSF